MLLQRDSGNRGKTVLCFPLFPSRPAFAPPRVFAESSDCRMALESKGRNPVSAKFEIVGQPYVEIVRIREHVSRGRRSHLRVGRPIYIGHSLGNRHKSGGFGESQHQRMGRLVPRSPNRLVDGMHRDAGRSVDWRLTPAHPDISRHLVANGNDALEPAGFRANGARGRGCAGEESVRKRGPRYSWLKAHVALRIGGEDPRGIEAVPLSHCDVLHRVPRFVDDPDVRCGNLVRWGGDKHKNRNDRYAQDSSASLRASARLRVAWSEIMIAHVFSARSTRRRQVRFAAKMGSSQRFRRSCEVGL